MCVIVRDSKTYDACLPIEFVDSTVDVHHSSKTCDVHPTVKLIKFTMDSLVKCIFTLWLLYHSERA